MGLVMPAVVVSQDNAQAAADDLPALLASFPVAAVSAVSETGFFVALPPTIPLSGQTVIRGHQTALELVVPEDLRLVIAAWQDVFIRGIASATVRPLGHRDRRLTIHYLDVRVQHGVLLCVITGDLDGIANGRGDAGAMRPRVSMVRKDGQAVFTAVDDAAASLLGREDLVGRRNVDLVHPDDAPLAIANWMDMLASPGQSRRVRLRQQHADGSWIWFEVTNHNLLNDPNVRSVVAEMVDISEEMAAHEFVRAQESLLRRLTDSLPVGIAQADGDGLIVHRNQRLTAILGRPSATTLAELFGSLAENHREPFFAAVDEALAGLDSDLEVEIGGNGSDPLRGHVTLRALEDSQGVIVCVDDITDRARLRDELHRRATFDALTGCHNRASTLSEVVQALNRLAAGGGAGVTVVFLDLDGFKSVNDLHGHATGDARLRDVGACLRSTVRSGDIVGRLGGDEFLVLSTAPNGPEQAMALAARLARSLGATIPPSTGRTAAASIGVTWTGQREPALSPSPDDLISAADYAMYRSKINRDGRPVWADSRRNAPPT
jgi:diguanylate cyclase (GGDEF)-like protein/PAS domain S-box-containing protein